MESADMSGGPAPDGEPVPQVHVHVKLPETEGVRFHCTAPSGKTVVLRIPAVWLYDNPREALLASIIGSVLMTLLWIVLGFLIMLIPIIGWLVGTMMLMVSPLGPFVFAYDIWRNYTIECQECHIRQVRVGTPFHYEALCECGARYRIATMWEHPISESNSNV
jgi:hypothetical protein